MSLLLDDPHYSNCFARSDDYNRWLCAAQTWCGKNFSLFRREKQCFKDFTTHFFDPNLNGDIGVSFGVGQFGPIRALMMDDRVGSSLAINFESHHDVTIVFKKILDPNVVTYYIAATNKYAIDVYASEHYDISQNPGIVATL